MCVLLGILVGLAAMQQMNARLCLVKMVEVAWICIGIITVHAQLVSQARIVKLTSMTAYHQHSVTRVSAVMVSTISLVSVTVDSQERFVT